MSTIQRVAQAISDYFVAEGMICQGDNELSAYALECRLSSVMHLVLLGAISHLFGLLAPAICFQVMFSSLKKRIGGAHAGSHFTCITSSIVMALALSYGATTIPATLSLPTICSAVMLMLVLVWIKAPVVHPHNPKTPQQLRACRRSALRAASLECAGVLLCYWLLPVPHTSIVVAGALGCAAAAVSLLPPVPKPQEGGDYHEESAVDESCPADREVG